MGRRAAEADQPDPQPLPRDRPKRRGGAVHTAAACQAPTRSSSGGCWRPTWPGTRRPCKPRCRRTARIYGAPGLLNSGTYHGYEGFRQWIGQWEEAWGDVDYELQDPIDVGETIVVIPARITGRGAGSGLEVDSTFGWLWQIRDDKMVRFHAYPAVDEALEAAKRLSGSD